MSRSKALLTGALVTVVLLPAGCRKAPPTAAQAAAGTQAAPTAPAAPVMQAGDPGAQVKRGVERQVDQNMLHQIGVFYQTYQTETGRPPAKLEDFLAYIQRDAHNEYQALKDGILVLNPGPRQDANTILCYEKNPDLNGNRLVLMGDCNSVRLMGEADFQAALKRAPR